MEQRSSDAGATVERDWRVVFMVGGIAALLVLAATLADIIISALPGWDASTVPTTMSAWYAQLQAQPLLGLRNLDLLNVTISVVAMPMYLALYGAQRRAGQAMAALALLVVLLGTAVFLAGNAALPMLGLSREYAAALTDAQRGALEAAGMALLSRGEHGSLGAFPAFFLSGLGTLLMGLAMLSGRVFSRATAWVAIAGTTLVLAYTIGAAFTEAAPKAMMAVIVPGGLLSMAWNVMVARRLFQLGAGDGTSRAPESRRRRRRL